VGTIDVWENAVIQNNLYAQGGLNVGPGGILSDGPLSITTVDASTADRETLCVAIGGGAVTRDVAANNCDISSARYKHDIQELDISGIDLVMSFKPSSFIKNSDSTDRVQWGFIAEDMAETDPHLALFEADGVTPYSISKYGIMATMAKAIQEMNSIIDISNATTSSPSFTIDSLGKLGIGTTNPSAELEISSSATTTLNINSTSASQGTCFVVKDVAGTTKYMRINTDNTLSISANSCE